MTTQLISVIQKKIPAHTKPVNYLMDALDLGRESAYRRLRGEIPFSFEEVALLSSKLDFSIDEIITNEPRRLYSNFPSNSDEASEKFLGMMKQYSKHYYTSSAEITIVQNRSLFITVISSELLLRFHYYRFLHQINHIASNCVFADLQLPKKILTLQNDLIKRSPEVKQITIIYDKRMLRNLCREMHYFYRRQLVSHQEVIALQEALNNSLTRMYKKLTTPQDINKTPMFYYVSVFDINVNTIYIQHDNNIISQFWVFPFSIIEIKNSEICRVHKYFLDMVKKYSALISQSNELVREEFVAQQRKYIDGIIDNNSEFLLV
ncbi:MAG: hypothetical protein LBS01_03350 [Prevotellaceae bacterium]|jgi:hypothetical protein|nr:hypothetical protein [Prevotellaceae bacterium]